MIHMSALYHHRVALDIHHISLTLQPQPLLFPALHPYLLLNTLQQKCWHPPPTILLHHPQQLQEKLLSQHLHQVVLPINHLRRRIPQQATIRPLPLYPAHFRILQELLFHIRLRGGRDAHPIEHGDDGEEVKEAGLRDGDLLAAFLGGEVLGGFGGQEGGVLEEEGVGDGVVEEAAPEEAEAVGGA